MEFEHLPLLETQRRLYAIPRGMERFQSYLAAMTDATGNLALPLAAMNPMGKEHVGALVDALLGMGAEGAAAEALEQARRRLAALPGRLRFGLVVTDDAAGGWTNRYFSEFHNHFQHNPLLERGWGVAYLWTSGPWDRAAVFVETLASAYRSAALLRHGSPRTLAQTLDLAGRAALFAGQPAPPLDADDLEYTRAVLQPYSGSDNYPTIFACLYGDAAAREAGYPPLGLSHRAGLAVAISDAHSRGGDPAAALIRSDID